MEAIEQIWGWGFEKFAYCDYPKEQNSDPSWHQSSYIENQHWCQRYKNLCLLGVNFLPLGIHR